MNAIFKFKKSIILLAVVLVTVAVGLSLYAFNGRIIAIDNDNAAYCYDLNVLNNAENPLAYPNVIKVSSYTVEENAGFKYYNILDRKSEVDRYVSDNTPGIRASSKSGIYTEVGLFTSDAEIKTGVEIYLLANTSDEYPYKLAPTVEYIQSRDFNVIINKKDVHTAGFRNTESDGALVVKMLIRIT